MCVCVCVSKCELAPQEGENRVFDFMETQTCLCVCLCLCQETDTQQDEGHCIHNYSDTHELIATHLFCLSEPASFCIFVFIFSFLSLFSNPNSLYIPIPLLSNPTSLYSLPRLEQSHVRVNITVQYILHAFLLVL